VVVTPSLRLLTFTQAAALVGCSARTIRRWAERGMFPVTYMSGHPRVREAHLRKAIERRTFVEGEER
jgi:excisionase family DNA binding protein